MNSEDTNIYTDTVERKCLSLRKFVRGYSILEDIEKQVRIFTLKTSFFLSSKVSKKFLDSYGISKGGFLKDS